MTTLPLIVDTALEAARAAGALARHAFLDAAAGKNPLVEEKTGHFDIVTAIDREAEAVASAIIFANVPGSRILGEEDGWRGQGDIVWYIDPIDGTSNFASGLPFFCVSIAAFTADGQPLCGVVFDPLRDEMFLARDGQLTLNGAAIVVQPTTITDRDAELLTNVPHEGARPSPDELSRFADLVQTFRGVRRLGSCALQMAYVAAGRAALGYDEKFQAWDIAAGLQLVVAGGGEVLAWDGEGLAIVDPMADPAAIRRFVIASRHFDLSTSMIIPHAAAKAA